MKKARLLTVKEVERLIQLGWMQFWDPFDSDKVIITYKTEDYYHIKSLGFFRLSKLKELKNKKFEYPRNNEIPKYSDNGFVLLNYKFFCFWENVLGKEFKFKEIKV